MKRFNTLRGIGGSFLAEEDFVVKESISRKFLAQYKRGKRVEKIDGPYTILKVTKKGLTTEEAIKRIAKIYGIKEKDIGFAGLKDRLAITKQYVTIKNFSGENCCTDHLSAEKTGMSPRPIAVGDLESNAFEITLHGCRNTKNLDALLKSLKSKGMPNYFGGQRFGTHNDNQIVGRHLIKKQYAAALKIINSHSREMHTGIKSVPKRRLKFFVNAYQSFIFNEMLETHIKKTKMPDCGAAPIMGARTKIVNNAFGKILKSIMEKEKITPKDFRLSDLKLSCDGGMRHAFVKPQIESAAIEGNDVRIKFVLPKGSYATVMLKEITG